MRGPKRPFPKMGNQTHHKKSKKAKSKCQFSKNIQTKKAPAIDSAVARFIQEQQKYGGNDFLYFDPMVQNLEMYSSKKDGGPLGQMVEYDSYSSPGSYSESSYEEEEEEEECNESLAIRSQFSLSSTSCNTSKRQHSTIGEKITITQERGGLKKVQGYMTMVRTESNESGHMRKIQQGVRQMSLVSYNDRTISRTQRTKLEDLETGQRSINMRTSLGKRQIEMAVSCRGGQQTMCKNIQVTPNCRARAQPSLFTNDRLIRGSRRLEFCASQNSSSSSSSESEGEERPRSDKKINIMENDRIIRRKPKAKAHAPRKVIFQDENGNEIDPDLLKRGKYVVDEEYEQKKQSQKRRGR